MRSQIISETQGLTQNSTVAFHFNFNQARFRDLGLNETRPFLSEHTEAAVIANEQQCQFGKRYDEGWRTIS